MKTASVDAYTIAFGIRNVTRMEKVKHHALYRLKQYWISSFIHLQNVVL